MGIERWGEPEPLLLPRVSDKPELAPHWVHSSNLYQGDNSRFVIVGPGVVVYRLTDSSH